MTSFLARVYAFKFFDSFILIFPLYTVMFVDAGLRPVDISVCLIAWSATSFVLQVPSGLIADRFPRRLVLTISQLFLAAGFAVWLTSPHFWGFLIGLVLWGFKSAFTSGTFEALLYDELKARGETAGYTRIFGRTRAVQAGGVLAAALGAAAMARFGFSAALVASIASAALSSVAAASLPPAPPALRASGHDYIAHLRQGFATAFRQPAVLSILVFSALVLALGAALEEFWPIFGNKVGLTRPVIALFVGGQNAVEVGVSLIAYRLAALPARAFYGAFALGGVLLLTAAGLFSPPAMLLLAAYSGLMKLVGVVFEGRLQHAIASDQRATIGSVKSVLAQIGITALYLSLGPLAQATSYRIAFLACGAAGALIGGAWLARSLTARTPTPA